MRLLTIATVAAALLGAATLAFAQPASAPAPDSMAQRMQACTACHGKEGRSTPSGYFPRIAGKPAGYLYNQLVAFRDGRRSNAAMSYLLQHLPDDYLQEIAQHFAALELPYAAPPAGNASPQALERGAALVLHGDARRAVPACVQCHGERMTGVEPGVPGLLGLPRDYLVAQLGAWRTGQRQAAAPDCMARIAGRLDAEDIGAVAAWLASRTPPADARPAAVPTAARPPMDCGSAWR